MSGIYAKGEHGKQTKGRIIENSLIAAQQKINTEGIDVYFPYSPYDLQVEYMSAVIRAISAGENGLLESPTGTGKTLCLLSSVLSWVDNHNSKND